MQKKKKGREIDTDKYDLLFSGIFNKFKKTSNKKYVTKSGGKGKKKGGREK